MATHSSTFAWRIPSTEAPGRLVHGVTESGMTETQLSVPRGEGLGTELIANGE